MGNHVSEVRMIITIRAARFLFPNHRSDKPEFKSSPSLDRELSELSAVTDRLLWSTGVGPLIRVTLKSTLFLRVSCQSLNQ